jgi:hypothetical protein
VQDTSVVQPDHSDERVDSRRVFWVGPLTLLASVIAVALIRRIAVSLLHPDPDFLPLSPETPIVDTIFAGAAAVFVFFRMCTYNLNPIAEYRSLAWKVLAVSFLPDVAVGLRHSWGGGWPEAFALMFMHVAVWILCVTMLPGLTSARRAERGRQ